MVLNHLGRKGKTGGTGYHEIRCNRTSLLERARAIRRGYRENWGGGSEIVIGLRGYIGKKKWSGQKGKTCQYGKNSN